MAEPVLDPMEAILLAEGPKYGMQLGERVTCLDKWAMAAGDGLFTPVPKDPLAQLTANMFGSVTDEQIEVEKDMVSLFDRYGTLVTAKKKYGVDFSVWGVPSREEIQTPADIDRVIQEGAYGVGLSIHSFDPAHRRNIGMHLADFYVEREGEQGEVLFWDLSSNPIAQRWQALAQQYPVQSQVHIPSFTRAVLETLRE